MCVVVAPALRRKETPAEVNVHCHGNAGTVITRGEQNEFSAVALAHIFIRSYIHALCAWRWNQGRRHGFLPQRMTLFLRGTGNGANK